MPRKTKSSSQNGHARNKIWVRSAKEYQRTLAYLRPVKAVLDKQDLVAKGPSKSNHVPTSKGIESPTASSLKTCLTFVEKQEALSRVNGKDRLKETHVLERNGKVNDASTSNRLKAMAGLVPKTTNTLGQYSDSSRLKKQASSDKEEDITSAKYSTTKLELSKGTYLVPKDNCVIEGNERQDGVVTRKEKIMEFGEYHKKEDTTKHTLDSTLLDIHCNSGVISSYPIGRDLSCKNVEQSLFMERNMGQFANCNKTSISKKRKEPLFKETPKAPEDNDSNVGVQVDYLSCKHTKKLRQSRVTRKDEVDDDSSDLNHVGVEDDTIGSSKNDHAKVLESCVERQCYSCSKPIDKPTWSGIFKTYDKEYLSMDGHLSTKSCEKVWTLSRELLQVVEVKKLSRLEVWHKAWEVSPPNGDDIGIYFFPHEMRQDEGLDQLVKEIMENDLALQAFLGEVEMLIFPSILLPIHHQTFQRKHYLWGVFKHRESKGVVVKEPPLNVVGHCEMEKLQKVALDLQPNHMLSVEKQNQEMSQMADAIPLERDMLPPNEGTEEVEASDLKEPMYNKGFDLRALCEEGRPPEFLTSQGRIYSNMGHTPSKLVGFVVQKTPKLEWIIQEIEREGALVFAMQGEMFRDGAWAGSNATASQK